MLKIKQLRQKKGLTLDQLADKSGVSKSMISNYEKGTSDITLTKLLDIANALNANFWDLVDLNTEELKGVKIDSSDIENEISATLDDLPLELQNRILKLYVIENRKTIDALRKSEIDRLNSSFSSLEEYVLENIALLTGKSQAQEFKKKLEEKQNANNDKEDSEEKAS